MIATALLASPAGALFESDDIPDELSWVADLSPRDVRVFYGEVYSAAVNGATAEELAVLLDEWKATAELEAAPEVLEHIERTAAAKFLTEEEWRANSHPTA